MATHKNHLVKAETYFITFTCYEWISLFEMTNLYSYFDKWFQYLVDNNVSILGYVIMPNHFHGLLHVHEECPKYLNQLVGNGKRFLAYEIVKRFKLQGDKENMLRVLKNGVEYNEIIKNKQHQVFKLSFDAKLCFSRGILETKLNYIHRNPTNGKWDLAEDWTLYEYSSAGFYERGLTSEYLTHYREVWG